MSPTDSEIQVENFILFKRRKKDTHTTKKSDSKSNPQVITIQEESLEERYAQEKTIMVLIGTPTTSFP